jgi:membrane protein DedA with SNARE-associated domain/membrane-associated phospholipid phosphatase
MPMTSGWFDATVAWIGTHPVAAGGLVFLVAFCDALAVVGIVVPALPLLFAVGVLVGLGHVSGPYALVAAAAGALLGDGLSYWIGRRWGPSMREHWPFRRYPQLLHRGEALFRRHGNKGIVIARYVGAVRPFVPAVAGMLGMPVKRYLPPSLFAAVTWAAVFLAPGWIFGASYDAVAAVADRLALALLALVAMLALAWAVVLYAWRWFAHHADTLLARALRWSSAHPRLGRYAQALVDPNRPESAPLALLAACLLAIGWAWFALLAAVLAHGGPLLVDQTVYSAMATLRNPLADRLMAVLATLGDAQVLLPACGAVLAWLLWRKRWIAAGHWLAALCFGLALTAGLDAWIDMPRPPGAPDGFGFPSIAVTMATIALGFFAVLVARALPGRRRVWPYVVGGALVTTIGFARLYLGAHWLSDIVGGVLLGISWLLALGIAYRSHVSRPLDMRPLAIAFYGMILVAGAWHAGRAAGPLLARFQAPAPTRSLVVEAWWNGATAGELPARRNERASGRRWPLDLQVAGPLERVRAALTARGWREQPQADWLDVLGLLDDDRAPAAQAVLPATLGAEAEVLLMRRPGPGAGEEQVLHVWRAPALLDDGSPLWLGSAQAMHYTRVLDVAGLWQPVADAGAARAAVREALEAFPARSDEREGIVVSRGDARAAPSHQPDRR